jgi:hypothetical protein
MNRVPGGNNLGARDLEPGNDTHRCTAVEGEQ